MTDQPRLIEVAFPLKQASLDSVHEKNVRHGHISTLHIWPARRPLAACRAALIATLLPDPGDPEKRKALLEKIGGRVVRKVVKKKVGGKFVENIKEVTEGGVLHWGNENSPDMDWFREEIRKAYGGRAPRVLDPFAGGGAIPLEAMRLGCEATAIDINPVAWFILKCTLEYPQKLAGRTRPLPAFAVKSPEFMEAYLKGTGVKSKKQLAKGMQSYQLGLFPQPPDADLSWHVRAWGWWVLQQARKELDRFYPVIDGKPSVAYLWARTVKCKNCRATIPLLKTQWLCKKDNKRVLLTTEPNADKTGVVFGIQTDVPVIGGNAAQRRAYDKQIGGGTMSRSGAKCPCCATIMTGEDIQLEGQTGNLKAIVTVVVVEGHRGKEYRLRVAEDEDCVARIEDDLVRVGGDLPFGPPREPVPRGASRVGGGSAFTAYLYGITCWSDLFTSRQRLALMIFVRHIRATYETLRCSDYPPEWTTAIFAYLVCGFDRMLDFNSVEVAWISSVEAIGHTFVRYALPITWDFSEAVPSNNGRGGWRMCLDAILKSYSTVSAASKEFAPQPNIRNASAASVDEPALFDVILTDPPYYDAIPYSDLMDFFHVWLRRSLVGTASEFSEAFRQETGPKWDASKCDGEMVDDAGRHGGDRCKSKMIYEEGMARVFRSCYDSLEPTGRFVVVFAHKKPDAWETLVSAIIRSGFVVDGSWPIQTEQAARMRAQGSAALASSVWLVCKKRPDTARPGWDNRVLDEMRERIHTRLREYWDAGIRGPDFVWAATGPAMEAYSRHPVVKKANAPGEVMSVGEFLRAVRRLVVDFVVGRVLTKDGDETSAIGLDDVTTYYLLHRHDFRLGEAPIGPCILYAVSCNLSDGDLADKFEVLARTGGGSNSDDLDDAESTEDSDIADEDAEPEDEGSGSKVKLRPWQQRKRKTLGYDVDGRPAPLIDQVHRLLHFWKAGDVVKVDDYLDSRGLRRSPLFLQLLQALIELAEAGSEERSLLESISNHLAARGEAPIKQPTLFPTSSLSVEDA